MDLTYGDSFSTGKRLGTVLSQFYNDTLKPSQSLSPENVIAGNGVAPLISQLSWYLCDQHEGILIGAPYYNRFDIELASQAQVKPIAVHFDEHVDPLSIEAIQYFENILKVSQTKVRALMISNPHNPTGRIIPRDTLIEYGKFCQKFDIHLVSDEIYALSTFKSKNDPDLSELHSVFCINWEEQRVDLSRIHVLVGASKVN